MGDHWVVGSTVVGDEESPTSPVTVVLVAAMEEVGVKEESITCFHLYLNQGKNLEQEMNKDRKWFIELKESTM